MGLLLLVAGHSRSAGNTGRASVCSCSSRRPRRKDKDLSSVRRRIRRGETIPSNAVFSSHARGRSGTRKPTPAVGPRAGASIGHQTIPAWDQRVGGLGIDGGAATEDASLALLDV